MFDFYRHRNHVNSDETAVTAAAERREAQHCEEPKGRWWLAAERLAQIRKVLQLVQRNRWALEVKLHIESGEEDAADFARRMITGVTAGGIYGTVIRVSSDGPRIATVVFKAPLRTAGFPRRAAPGFFDNVEWAEPEVPCYERSLFDQLESLAKYAERADDDRRKRDQLYVRYAALLAKWDALSGDEQWNLTNAREVYWRNREQWIDERFMTLHIVPEQVAGGNGSSREVCRDIGFFHPLSYWAVDYNGFSMDFKDTRSAKWRTTADDFVWKDAEYPPDPADALTAQQRTSNVLFFPGVDRDSVEPRRQQRIEHQLSLVPDVNNRRCDTSATALCGDFSPTAA